MSTHPRLDDKADKMTCNHDDDDFAGPSGRTKIGSALDFELIQRVFAMSDGTRAKLLAFLHLAENPSLVKGDLAVDPSGEVSLRLFNLKEARVDFQPDRESAVEPLQ